MKTVPMKKTGFLFIAALLLLAACHPKAEWSVLKIDQMEQTLLANAQRGNVDSNSVNTLLRAYEDFADRHNNHAKSPEFLLKAADFYRYMGKPLRSIVMYDKIYTNFPNYEKRPFALFLQGFVFENEVGNVDAAREKYHQFLKQYPDHKIAEDVRTSLRNLGKTPEQLVQEFMAQQQMDSLMTTHNAK